MLRVLISKAPHFGLLPRSSATGTTAGKRTPGLRLGADMKKALLNRSQQKSAVDKKGPSTLVHFPLLMSSAFSCSRFLSSPSAMATE